MIAQPQRSIAAQPAAITTADARKLIERLTGVMAELLSVIDQETELVRAGRIQEATALAAKKSEISHHYVTSISAIRDNRAALMKSIPDLLGALRRHHETFGARLQTNLTVLATAHAVSEGIIRGVNGEIQRRNLPNGYTAAGHRATPGPRQVTPLSVSRSL